MWARETAAGTLDTGAEEVSARGLPDPAALRVLVADDDADTADSLATLLGLWGHEGCVARTGAGGADRRVLAWSAAEGKPVDPKRPAPPPMPPPGPAHSPDGRLCARPQGSAVAVVDLLRPTPPPSDPWPFPDAAERRRHHGERAALAEKQKQHFAAAFHLGRLLLDDPDADLKERLQAALDALAAQDAKK